MGLDCALIGLCEGIVMEMGGFRARIKVPKLADIIFKYQQGLTMMMEGTGEMAWMGVNEDQCQNGK